MEDVATGSAAGCVAAYLVTHRLCRPGETFTLHQGRFTGRPSRMFPRVEDESSAQQIIVGGEVSLVGTGDLHA